jgi:hypothetical protein
MLAEGLGNKEIAGQLGISDHTAKFHVASILGKLHAQTRTEAVTVSIRRGPRSRPRLERFVSQKTTEPKLTALVCETSTAFHLRMRSGERFGR